MNREAFYNALRPHFGALTQANVVGFELVLDEAIKRGTALQSLAYILATAWWESGKTMQPVKEAYWLSEAWRRKNLRYFPFYGRGLVQLTWEENYSKVGRQYGLDLVSKPDRVMEPGLSVRILFDGMEHGWFTGKALGDYIDNLVETSDEDFAEYQQARRIVNGTDKWKEIARLAVIFEDALQGADYATPTMPPDYEPPDEPEPIALSNPFTTLIRAFLRIFKL